MALTAQRKTDDGRIDLLVTIDAETMKAAASKEYSKKKGTLSVPGFRKGKVPRAIIERMYGEFYFYDEALNGMINDVYINTLDESEIDVIDQPKITVDSMSIENGIDLVFSVLPRPQLEVKEYKNLKVNKHIHPVEEEDINAEIDEMREKNARLIEVSDRPAKLDDIAVIDFEGFMDEQPFEGGKGENFSLPLGSGQFIPGFEEQITGHKRGEEFEVKVTFPDGYSAENLSGKEAVFKVVLREIRNKELPEADDEFAKDVSDYDTLEELKNSIKGEVEKNREKAEDTEVENQLGELLTEQLTGEVPDVMIDSRIDDLVRDFSYRMGSQGIDLSTYLKYTGQDIDSFRQGMRENAEKQVKIRLSLEAVARAENILITDEDVETEYMRMAEEYETEIEKVKNMIPEKEMKKDMAVNKALDIVKNHAEINEETHSIHDHDSSQ